MSRIAGVDTINDLNKTGLLVICPGDVFQSMLLKAQASVVVNVQGSCQEAPRDESRQTPLALALSLTQPQKLRGRGACLLSCMPVTVETVSDSFTHSRHIAPSEDNTPLTVIIKTKKSFFQGHELAVVRVKCQQRPVYTHCPPFQRVSSKDLTAS